MESTLSQSRAEGATASGHLQAAAHLHTATPEAEPGTPPLRASARLEFLELYRTPYAVAQALRRSGVERLRAERTGAELCWPAQKAKARAAAVTLRLPGGDVPVFAAVLGDAEIEALLAADDRTWTRELPLTMGDGHAVSCTWRAEDGSLFLPFDPDEAISNYRTERYLSVGKRPLPPQLGRSLMRAYYRVRPVLPRRLQIAIRRLFTRVQERSRFPRWPIESALHDLIDFLFARIAELAGEPVPRLGPWPNGRAWALVLTHDVERAKGWAAMDHVIETERTLGVRSSWNFVPARYPVDAARVYRLLDDGFEVGVHGLHHDGRDLESWDILNERLPAMRHAAREWRASGFRAPAMHRDWELMPHLGFDYDSSYPDTDPFEPQAGGCCTWLPFFNRDLVELPVTLQQDHTLFVILRHRDETAWVRKTEFLKARGGMALINTHPDYLADTRVMAAYERFLRRFASSPDAWIALPREVSRWWRERAASHIVRRADGWQIVGPASNRAQLELIT